MDILPSKFDGEKIVVSFDFTQALSGSEALTGTPTVAHSLNSGSGTLTLGTAAIQGPKVLVAVSGGTAESTYRLSAICDTTNANKRLEIVALLPVK